MALVTRMPCAACRLDGKPDLKLGNLAVEVPRHEARTQQFHIVQLGLAAASAVIPPPSSPDGSTEAG